MIDIRCECGEVYHTDESQIGKAIRCRRCGVVLRIQISTPHSHAYRRQGTQDSYQQPGKTTRRNRPASEDVGWDWPSDAQPARPSVPRTRVRTRNWILVILAIVALASALTLSSPETDGRPVMRDTDGRFPSDMIPGNGVELHQVTRYGIGELSVDNGTEFDAVVKLVDARTMRTERMMFVRSGSRASLGRIYAGTYLVRFTTGYNWQATSQTFERHARYLQFGETFDFEEIPQTDRVLYSSYEVTLHPLRGGNIETTPLTEEEFLRTDLPPMPQARHR